MARSTQTRSLFRMQVSIGIDIDAPASAVWPLLYDAARLAEWNSTIDSIEGEIAPGNTIEVRVPIAPDRVFKLAVSDVVENERMTWSDGFFPVFRGVRTYHLLPIDGGVRFEMAETFSGLMLPMIARSLPDFGPVFETYAAELKALAESEA